MTARDVINSSLRLLGVLASGEAASSTEASDALNAMNDMIDTWSTENLLIPNKVRESFPLVANQQTYTMGSGANFNTTRPMKIENALLQISGSSPLLEIPMKVITKDEYAGIILKGTTSTYPLYLFSDNANPSTNISVWPVPTAINNLILYSWKPLSDLSTLSTTISLPPGYQRALRYNLAVDLSAEYGRQVPEAVATIAIESKAAIKRMNFEAKLLRVDDELMAKPAVWNWMTGEPT